MRNVQKVSISGMGSVSVSIESECQGRRMGTINVPGVVRDLWLVVRVTMFGVVVFLGSWRIV